MLWEERKAAEAAATGDEDGVRYWNAIKACVDQAPPLDEEQKSRLRVLLRPSPAAGLTAPPIKNAA